jgi:hypothetical protein
MECTGYQAELIKTEDGFEVVWSDPKEVENDKWSLNPFFRMAMEVINIAVKNSTEYQPFYWINGRKSWSIQQVNIILEHIGIVNFLHTLGDNNGGKEYKYGIDMLDAYRRYIKTREPSLIMTYSCDSILDWMKVNIKDFHLLDMPAFQDAGEEGAWHLVNENGVYTKYWADFKD